MTTLRLTLTTDNGTLLDTVEVDRDDLLAAQRDAMRALDLLNNLRPGTTD